MLDFDLENRPLTYRGYDKTSAEVTAIAARWVGGTTSYCWLLERDEPGSAVEMLLGFRALYEQATMVTGHYIRRHDLPIMNMALIEAGLAPLGPKLTSDTCLDLIRFSEYSRSQESLAELLGVPAPKVGMSQAQWRSANRLEPAGLAATRRRVVGDVDQHIQLRAVLHERGLLRAPKMWSP